eukprot:gene42987-57166_t
MNIADVAAQGLAPRDRLLGVGVAVPADFIDGVHQLHAHAYFPELGRRDALRGLAGVSVAASLGSPFAITDAQAQVNGPSTLTFKELAHTLDDTQHVAEGYEMQVLIRWGDPLIGGGAAFDPAALTAAEQENRFGYNNDYLGLYPMPAGSRSGDRFLMVANHEYTNANLMFPGLGAGRGAALKATREQVAVEMASVGGAIVEIVREGAGWKGVPD